MEVDRPELVWGGREGGREGPGWTREAERNTGYGAVSTEAPVENKTR